MCWRMCRVIQRWLQGTLDTPSFSSSELCRPVADGLGGLGSFLCVLSDFYRFLKKSLVSCLHFVALGFV